MSFENYGHFCEHMNTDYLRRRNKCIYVASFCHFIALLTMQFTHSPSLCNHIANAVFTVHIIHMHYDTQL